MRQPQLIAGCRGVAQFTPLLDGFSVLGERVVRIAVEPALAGFGRGDHGMTRGSRMGAGVLVRRRIAAERHAARLARAQMDPLRADLDALLALARARLLHRFNLGDMTAGSIFHGFLALECRISTLSPSDLRTSGVLNSEF